MPPSVTSCHGPRPRWSPRRPRRTSGTTGAGGLLPRSVPLPTSPSSIPLPGHPRNGEWNLTGTWTITPQYVLPSTGGTLQLGFDAKNVFLVIEPEDRAGAVSVFVDDKPGADTVDVKKGALAPRESRMYQLVGLAESGPHVLRLEVKGKLRLFAFTFG